MARKRVYKIKFISQGKLYELFAREVGQSTMYGFVELGEIIFDEKSAVLVDPSEEQLKAEFAGVKRTYIPLHTILRIDEVDKEGINKITEATNADTNVAFFPSSLHTPGKDKK
ncbi:DUF1820 family protein [Nitrosococcus oceani]|uniref:DUF1820 domain-containing protein n=2 Tax=Nitrosococcus oceani TaxID=1229 RepID=Q3J9K5_NITOC|nr:DUF1820 family protein [Nitrosococcus oceani]KFI19095.1 hypothetical protein IB75_10830 [Nitrosococcus oceani C-27]ABA58491.1 conserved hypothetical protein [Nitrosococcus oceani ATCC 19707]EDZ67586.1 conserved domain protein [Nitrosococcus oceani AFC27]KFI22313.1 hypothetical protein HW44_10320 [Nitrosococcus oceani]GEM18887.1 hypothetical protein NONS58_02520 [Nitrosococcus oceani]